MDPSSHLAQVVEGTRIPFNNESLASITDMARVRKIYKIDAPSDGKRGGKQVNGRSGRDWEDEREEIEKMILGMIAIKGS